MNDNQGIIWSHFCLKDKMWFTLLVTGEDQKCPACGEQILPNKPPSKPPEAKKESK